MQEQEQDEEQVPLPLTLPPPLPHPMGTSTTDEHALSHDAPDDTLGVELDEVFARLAADDHAGDAPKEPEKDEPHDA